MRELILASTSPYRRAMLTSAGFDVRIEAPGVDERAVTAADPVALARELARRKAIAVAARHPDAWVLGADQVAYDPERGEQYDKPASPAEHLERLRAMVGRSHLLTTGFALVDGGEVLVEHETTTVTFRRDIEDSELVAYVATGEGSGCAGGYAAEGRGGFLVERIDGDWFNVIGLPLARVIGALRARGWRFA